MSLPRNVWCHFLSGCMSFPGGLCLEGFIVQGVFVQGMSPSRRCLCPGALFWPGVSLSERGSPCLPPSLPMDKMTEASENITFPCSRQKQSLADTLLTIFLAEVSRTCSLLILLLLVCLRSTLNYIELLLQNIAHYFLASTCIQILDICHNTKDVPCSSICFCARLLSFVHAGNNSEFISRDEHEEMKLKFEEHLSALEAQKSQSKYTHFYYCTRLLHKIKRLSCPAKRICEFWISEIINNGVQVNKFEHVQGGMGMEWSMYYEGGNWGQKGFPNEQFWTGPGSGQPL